MKARSKLKHVRGGNCWAGNTRLDVCMKHEEPRGSCKGCPRCPACEVKPQEAGCQVSQCEGSVREAARRRKPLDGADAQALEHAITITERERDALKAERDDIQCTLTDVVKERDALGADLATARKALRQAEESDSPWPIIRDALAKMGGK